ncbi:mycofactocin-coupled SDR family oxidoreductase [Sporichthya sp.]|uniref:mycofactocin-coupled SDR family oxidoreductase n=1 Tax=Sporichthya sp. TaxID=65475 RepID=UPI0017D19AA2|nr:mycofactocin-coupled SDR family oxidoreductase [Sporichthya sp.]MBA3743885.1 mycofactocin-coupled SDR family oxidoreductase [Sporichthya sp.]
MGRLTGKVAFITGVARGQGRSHALRLAEEGAAIVGVDLCSQMDSVGYPMATPDDLAETVKLVEERDARIVATQADVRDLGALRTAVEAGVAELGRLDIVLANAGIFPGIGEVASTGAAFDDVVDVNMTGVYNTIEAALPQLLAQGEGGSIVLTSSVAGLSGRLNLAGNAGMMGYIAAKHGVVGLMRAYANMLAPQSIRVNSVHPGAVNTPMIVNEGFGALAAEHPVELSRLVHAMPVEMLEAVDISNAILWLCSDEARYVTGVTVPVDGGFMIL